MKFGYVPLIGVIILIYSIIAIGGGAIIKNWKPVETAPAAQTATPPAPVASAPVSSSSPAVTMKLDPPPAVAPAQAICPPESRGMQAFLDAKFFSIPMVSKDHWTVRWHDIFLIIGLGCLFLETLRSTGTGDTTVVNHILSMGVFVIALVEFLIVRGFATSTFFFLMMMALMDVVAGFVISLKSARRDIGVSGGGLFGSGDH